MTTDLKLSSNASGAALYGRERLAVEGAGSCSTVSKALRSSTMSPATVFTPRPCTRRSSSHRRSTTSLGSPWPLMYRLPNSVPSRTAPSTYTGVFQV